MMNASKPEEATGQNNGKFDNLVVTGSITVKHPDADFGLTIQSDSTGAGIWIGNRTFVAIHNISGQCCLCLGGPKDKGGHAFAISIDKDGMPVLQLCFPGRDPIILSGDELVKHFA